MHSSYVGTPLSFPVYIPAAHNLTDNHIQTPRLATTPIRHVPDCLVLNHSLVLLVQYDMSMLGT